MSQLLKSPPSAEASDTSRISAFSDGVFAVAVTLLVLRIPVPEPSPDGAGLWDALRGEWPSFATYATSFFIIGVMWVNHHGVFRRITRVTRPLMFLNLVLLLAVAAMPFTTALLATYLDEGSWDAHVAAAIYSGTLLFAALMFSAIWLFALHRGGLVTERLTMTEERAVTTRFGGGVVIYAVTVALSFLSAPVTLGVHFLVALYYCFDHLLTPNADPDLDEVPERLT